jgi:putative cardiolipin synthase
VNWIVICCGVVLLMVAASLAAAYGYGRFLKKARGEPSSALPRGGQPLAALERKIEERRAGQENASGLIMLSSNLDAFVARALSARGAERSLDLMYYIWQSDLTGRLLLNEVLNAADRGVRVRLLLDDIGVKQADAAFLAIDSHPNIELRLFSPTFARNALRRGLEMVLRAFSVTRRMHHKAWIVDGCMAVVGGRNIADAYFDAAEASNFRDLDLVTIGPIVQQAEQVFDEYWNSELALPITALSPRRPQPLRKLKRRIEVALADDRVQPYLRRLETHTSLDWLLSPDAIHWDQSARILSDPVGKAQGKRGNNWLMRDLLPLLGSAQTSLEITSPYFIPGSDGAEYLARLVERGVAVTVLTNSLAATDVAAVHGGYARYRHALLASGVALYELQRAAPRHRMSLTGSRNASLHTKAFSVDDCLGFIGSLNFDPRSVSLNTEMGIVFEAPRLVRQLRDLFAEEIAPAVSYRVSLENAASLVWTGEKEGRPQAFRHDPEASLLRRLIAEVVGWLPLESQL